jgi:hypothetical protein
MSDGGFIASRYEKPGNRGVRVADVRGGRVNYAVDGIFTLAPCYMPIDEFLAWMADGYTPCNQGLGSFNDNPELLQAAVAYLNSSN